MSTLTSSSRSYQEKNTYFGSGSKMAKLPLCKRHILSNILRTAYLYTYVNKCKITIFIANVHYITILKPIHNHIHRSINTITPTHSYAYYKHTQNHIQTVNYIDSVRN